MRAAGLTLQAASLDSAKSKLISRRIGAHSKTCRPTESVELTNPFVAIALKLQ